MGQRKYERPQKEVTEPVLLTILGPKIHLKNW